MWDLASSLNTKSSLNPKINTNYIQSSADVCLHPIFVAKNLAWFNERKNAFDPTTELLQFHYFIFSDYENPC